MDQILPGSYNLCWLSFTSVVFKPRTYYGVEAPRSYTLPLPPLLSLGMVVPSQGAAPTPGEFQNTHSVRMRGRAPALRLSGWELVMPMVSPLRNTRRNTGFNLFTCEGKVTLLVQENYMEKVGYSYNRFWSK